MRKRFTKALAVCMACGVLAGSGTYTVISQNTVIQKAAAKESTKIIGIAESEKESQKEEIEKKGSQDTEKDFLIQAKNKTERKKVTAVLKNCMDSTSDTADTLKKENILLADLSAKQINELNQKYDITIEQDRKIEGSAQNKITKTEQKAIESMVKKQWSRKAVGAEAINASVIAKNTKKVREKKVCVAILDSGLDETSDVNLAGSISFTPDDSVKDITGHGTMVTNIIAENHNGISKAGIIPADSKVETYSVRVLDEKNEAPISRVIEALEWCIENDINIIHMSFGMNTDSEILHSIIKKAEKAGILMVAAVGNNGEKEYNKVQYPAAYEEVIGVGSVDEDMKYSSFSATGDEVELVAPGENVPISSYWEQNGVGSGTSYAAPHVTAVAAMLWSKDTEKSAEFIRSLLNESAKDLGNSEKYGNGLVDYEYASEIFKSFSTTKKEIKENPVKVKSYEVAECLKASWDYAGHKKWIKKTGDLSADEIETVRYASYYADTANGFEDYDILHARENTNYVAAAKCLYRASRLWKNGYDLSAITKVELTVTEDSANILAAMKIAVKKHFEPKRSGKVSKRTARLQLLGLAIHVAGDAYAHKTKCLSTNGGIELIDRIYSQNKEAIEKGLKNKKSITQMIEAIKEGLTTSAMQKYFKSTLAGKKICNKYYTDSVNYMKKRYSVGTKVATEELLSRFTTGGSFSPYVFCPYNSDKNYRYQLRSLAKFIKKAGYDVKEYNLYSVEQWNALSY